MNDPILAQLFKEADAAIQALTSSEEESDVSGEVDDDNNDAATAVSDDPVPPSPRRAAMPPPPRQKPLPSRLAPSKAAHQPTSTASLRPPEDSVTSQADVSTARPAATSITMLADDFQRHLEDDAQQSMLTSSECPPSPEAQRTPEAKVHTCCTPCALVQPHFTTQEAPMSMHREYLTELTAQQLQREVPGAVQAAARVSTWQAQVCGRVCKDSTHTAHTRIINTSGSGAQCTHHAH